MLTTHESISVAILVVYIPALFAAIAVAFRQGFTRSSGYVHLVIFCGLRIAGGVLEIISQKHPSNASDAEWAAIVSSIGLSPLLLASSGMLQRVNNLIKTPNLRTRILQAVLIPAILALALAIVGGTKLSFPGEDGYSASAPNTAFSYLKAAGVIFLLTLILLIGVAGATSLHTSQIPAGFKRIYFIVLLAFPFLTVRTVYVMLVYFANDADFNILDPNAFVQLGMSVIVEMVVTIMFVAVGFTVPVEEPRQMGVGHGNGKARR